MSAERGRKSNNRHSVLGGSDHRICRPVFGAFDGVWTLDALVEVGKDVTVGGCGSVVSLIYNNGPQLGWVKLFQSRSSEERLVCCNGAEEDAHLNAGTKGK